MWHLTVILLVSFGKDYFCSIIFAKLLCYLHFLLLLLFQLIYIFIYSIFIEKSRSQMDPNKIDLYVS